MFRWLSLILLCEACTAPPVLVVREPTVGRMAPPPAPPLEPARPPLVSRADPAPPHSTEPAPAAPTPEAELSDAELEDLVEHAPESLGSASIGTPNGGVLFNAVQLTEDDLFKPVDVNRAWGTEETIGYLRAAARKVHDAFPETGPLPVGHISAKHGGHLSPHHSHQAGRDVDISYFYRDGGRWYQRATPSSLDLPRTWAFVRALIVETDVEMILIDHRLSAALRQFARKQGEDEAWLASLFEDTNHSRALIRHAPGHATHMHVRFRNPRAERLARRIYPLLVEHELIDKIEVYRYHRVTKGETLGKLAKRYGTTVRAIKRANGLRSTLIQARKVYKIPTPGARWYRDAALEIPPRRLPPEGAEAPSSQSRAANSSQELEQGS